MSDLREYSFRDWLALFLRALPALFLASVILLSPLLVLWVFGVVVWFFGR
jgi:hypothetical protein